MVATPETIAYGNLDENGDTWFLMRPDRMILLEVLFWLMALCSIKR